MDYLIGHLIGDFLLQNDWQAMNKKSFKLKGWIACLVHCILYTVAVTACTGWWRWDLIGLVFLSHFPIDKTYVVAWWMKKAGIFRRVMELKTLNLPSDWVMLIDHSVNNHKTWAYLFVDNTVHLTLLWLVARFAV